MENSEYYSPESVFRHFTRELQPERISENYDIPLNTLQEYFTCETLYSDIEHNRPAFVKNIENHRKKLLINFGEMYARISIGKYNSYISAPPSSPSERQEIWYTLVRSNASPTQAWRKHVERAAEGGLFYSSLIAELTHALLMTYEEEPAEITQQVPAEFKDLSKPTLDKRYDTFISCIHIEGATMLLDSIQELGIFGRARAHKANELFSKLKEELEKNDLLGKLSISKNLADAFNALSREEPDKQARRLLYLLASRHHAFRMSLFDILEKFVNIYYRLDYEHPAQLLDLAKSVAGIIDKAPPPSTNEVATKQQEHKESFHAKHTALQATANTLFKPWLLSAKQRKALKLTTIQHIFVTGHPGDEKILQPPVAGIPKDTAAVMISTVHHINQLCVTHSSQKVRAIIGDAIMGQMQLEKELEALRQQARKAEISEDIQYPTIMPLDICIAKLGNPNEWPGIRKLIIDNWPNGSLVVKNIESVLYYQPTT